jgi:hypothetical protein
MFWQYLLVGIIVLAAAGFLARQSWRTWFGTKAGCGGGCGCAGAKGGATAGAAGSAAKLVSVDELTARIRSSSGPAGKSD